MDIVLFIARLLLAGVFLVAGVAKLADRAGSRQGLIDFGVPGALTTPFGILLPLAELAVAISLIPAATAWWGALGALALLLLFVAGISFNLARGRKPDCRCFGQLHSSPAGWKTLSRNGALSVVAAFVLWEGYDGAGASALEWLWTLSTAQLVGLVGGLLALGLVAGQWWFLVHLLRQNGRLLVRVEGLEARVAAGGAEVPAENSVQETQPPPEGLPVGTPAPGFALSGLYGESLTLEALLAPGKPLLLTLTDPNCGPCTALLPEIGRWQQEYSAQLGVSLISRGTAEENRAKSTEHGLTSVLLQQDWEVAEAYQVSGTPSAVLVSPDGTVGSPVAGGAEAIRASWPKRWAKATAASYRCSRLPKGSLVPTAGRFTPTIMVKTPSSRPYRRAPRSESPLRLSSCGISRARPSTWPASGARRPWCCFGIRGAASASRCYPT